MMYKEVEADSRTVQKRHWNTFFLVTTYKTHVCVKHVHLLENFNFIPLSIDYSHIILDNDNFFYNK